jgi:hypothetical protein
MAKTSISQKTILMKKKGSIWDNASYKRTIRLVTNEVITEAVVRKVA